MYFKLKKGTVLQYISSDPSILRIAIPQFAPQHVRRRHPRFKHVRRYGSVEGGLEERPTLLTWKRLSCSSTRPSNNDLHKLFSLAPSSRVRRHVVAGWKRTREPKTHKRDARPGEKQTVLLENRFKRRNFEGGARVVAPVIYGFAQFDEEMVSMGRGRRIRLR